MAMGGGAVASGVSVGLMAGLFGTAGAGLAGYKMMKRTRGVEEFEFEQYDEKVMVSPQYPVRSAQHPAYHPSTPLNLM